MFEHKRQDYSTWTSSWRPPSPSSKRASRVNRAENCQELRDGIYMAFSVPVSPSAETSMSVKKGERDTESKVGPVGSRDAGKILVLLWLIPNAGLPDKRCIYILKRSR